MRTAKQRAGVAALGVALAIAFFSACGASQPTSQLPGTLVSGDWQITVSNYTRDGNIVTVPVELTNVGGQAQSPPGTEFGNYAIIDDKGSEFSIQDGGALALPDGFIRQVNPGVSLPIIPLVFSVPAGASGLSFQFKGGYTSPEVLFQLDGFTSRIAFSRISFQAGAGIFTMFSDGSDVRQLTDDGLYPSWSPDGSRIAFVSDRDGDSEIYTMSSDGSDVRQLTNNEFYDSNPVWSPDSSRIAFFSIRDGDAEIYTMSSDGSDVRQLTNTNNQSVDIGFSWSPDGSRIAFVSPHPNIRFSPTPSIYTIRSDGSDVRRLTNNEFYDSNPVWSPDGSRIAFVSRRDGDLEIYTMSSDGSDVRQLTDNQPNTQFILRNLAWSPGGSRIAFPSLGNIPPNGYSAIQTMLWDGSDVKRILLEQLYLEDNPQVQHISWSPLLPLVDDFGGELVDNGEFDLVVDGRIWGGGAGFGSSFGLATPGVGWDIRTVSGESEIALAEHLASLGESVRMFGAWWCPHCHAQKEMFGAEAWAIVKSRYVECWPDNRRSGVTPECPFVRFPTWRIYSSPTSGALNLAELATATGYAGPTDFRFIQP